MAAAASANPGDGRFPAPAGSGEIHLLRVPPAARAAMMAAESGRLQPNAFEPAAA